MICKRGHERAPGTRCAECKKIKGAEYRATNAALIAARKAKHRAANPETYRKQYEKRDVSERRATVARCHTKRRNLRRAAVLALQAKRRAAERNLPYDLHEHLAHYQAVIDAGLCQETGLPFDLASKFGPYTPSFDRVKPELGYVHGNVRVILWALNAGFSTWGEDTYAKIATAYLQSRSKSSRL